jgi:hypothetical protein
MDSQMTPSHRNHLRIPIGGGLNYGVSFAWPDGAPGYRLRVTLHVNDGDKWWPHLEPQRAEINAALGDVAWERLEDSNSARLAVYFDAANPVDRPAWPVYRTWAIDTLARVRAGLQPVIQSARHDRLSEDESATDQPRSNSEQGDQSSLAVAPARLLQLPRQLKIS